MKDSLGDRMKAYEAAETDRRFMPLLPIYARIDGRSFSQFTNGMKRPFDPAMTDCMIKTALALANETNATVAYTQSDEISLVWKNDKYESEMWFGGKIFKITSMLSAIATSAFTTYASVPFGHKIALGRRPLFDARVFQLPNLEEAANCILWRVNDAVKNSISMAARSVYSHKELQGKNGKEMQEMLFQKGINWNDYPRSFKEGTFIRKVSVSKPMDPEEYEKIPEHIRQMMPNLFFDRMEYQVMDKWPPFKSLEDKAHVLFGGIDGEKCYYRTIEDETV